jgi:hypothetical protein
MATPLENYINEVIKRSDKNFIYDRSTLAIGTDNDYDKSLLGGVKWICNMNENVYDLDESWVKVPLCFSYEIVSKGGNWSEERNLNWINHVTKAEDCPRVCHVFHAKAAETLNSAIGGNCTPGFFNQNYNGQRNSTFKEVLAVLTNGFTRVTTVNRPNHALLWKIQN